MRTSPKPLFALAALAAGSLLAAGCSVADQIAATIRLALGIVDIWV